VSLIAQLLNYMPLLHLQTTGSVSVCPQTKLKRRGYAAGIGLLIVHSSRSRLAGSIPRARRAGIHAASSPNRAIVAVTPPSTRGSRGVAS
jgi:hypothetical protein